MFMMVSEAKKEAIHKEAEKILDNFGKTLEKVPTPKKTIRRSTSGRPEGSAVECDADFRDRIFENAPDKTKDFIIAEKGTWN